MKLDGKRILVTGGTGSLGQTIVGRLLTGEMGRPAKITVFSRDEAKQHYMRLAYLNREVATDEVIYRNFQQLLSFRISDVRDYYSVLDAVRDSEVIIQAAALKQVPTCEYFPVQAVHTNVLGAENIVRAVREVGSQIETVVGISTDKACKPINVMGMTKALMERILIEANIGCQTTRLVCVRYGNVIASRGSVIPLFLNQIAHGGPVTVTSKEMTRFLLDLNRAVDTIFAAINQGLPGELYIPRVPAARIVDLAEVLINGRDIPIKFTGVRPGEKIHEIMIAEEESYRTIERNGYYVIRPMLPELDMSAASPRAINGEYSSSHITLDHEGLCQLVAPYLTQPALRRGPSMKVMTLFGTRPEIIRLSQVIKQLDRYCDQILVHTGQNYDPNLSDIFFQELGVRTPSIHFGIQASDFGSQIAQIIAHTSQVLTEIKPDRLLILGDTNSGLSAIVAARMQIPVYHMEAGNRCYDNRVPEEVNRRIIDHCSNILMPYTHRSKENLLNEGIERRRIFVIGNPIYEVLTAYQPQIMASKVFSQLEIVPQQYFLLTAHRFENVDDPARLKSLLEGLNRLAAEYLQPIVVSFHPRTADRIKHFGLEIRSDYIRVLSPLGFFDFVSLERNARCVISDSGTVQEECCIYKVPNVTIRDVTERAETIECGSNILCGVSAENILSAVKIALSTNHKWIPPAEYVEEHVSDAVVKIVLGYYPLVLERN